LLSYSLLHSRFALFAASPFCDTKAILFKAGSVAAQWSLFGSRKRAQIAFRLT
jgi:hypothetical protein